MTQVKTQVTERTRLIQPRVGDNGQIQDDEEASIPSLCVSKDESALANTSVGERLPYNDYTTIDWLHDLVKDSYRYRLTHSRRGLLASFLSAWDSCEGWFVAALIGVLTAIVAFLVDVSESVISDWKFGYCSTNLFKDREMCCAGRTEGTSAEEYCSDWRLWAPEWPAYSIFIGFALLYGLISSSLTMLTKHSLPTSEGSTNQGKVMYMAAGSGIPEIKTILSGFVIKGFLGLKVLVVKGVGAVFAVATTMCLGKEGPFVHISACVGFLVGLLFQKYQENSRNMRELLSAACSAGLSVAFGAPIGGVLFSYEEISVYFPRKVLWRAFFCSLTAAVTLRALNPTGTGKLVLFETSFGVTYKAIHFPIFICLGIAGGLFGGIFCKANFLWSRSFRKFSIIKNYPVFEVFLVALLTAGLQYPSPLTRETGDFVFKLLLADCKNSPRNWVCRMESEEANGRYIGWLTHGVLVKLALTIVTFGIKVPSGIIIPSLNAGAFFGRLVGQAVHDISPGVFAMVGGAAFLAGVSRMTLSLCVIMFELTSELEYIVPNMVAILVAKWVADAIGKEGVYDLAQTIMGYPFLDPDGAIAKVQEKADLVEVLIPPKQTMKEITLELDHEGRAPKHMLKEKLAQLKARGLMDAGLVLTSNGMLRGYLAERELDFGITELGKPFSGPDTKVQLLRPFAEEEIRIHMDLDMGDTFDLSMFVDRTPLTICAKAPIEYAVEMFSKLGLRYLCVVDETSLKVVGVIIKKRLVGYLESAC